MTCVLAGGVLVCAKAPVWADNVSSKTALAMSPREGLRRGCVEVSAHTGYPPVKAFCGGGSVTGDRCDVTVSTKKAIGDRRGYLSIRRQTPGRLNRQRDVVD